MKSVFNPEKMKREVYCFACKDYSVATEPAPKCPICKNWLITVARSALTGKIITGSNNGDGKQYKP